MPRRIEVSCSISIIGEAYPRRGSTSMLATCTGSCGTGLRSKRKKRESRAVPPGNPRPPVGEGGKPATTAVMSGGRKIGGPCPMSVPTT